MSVLRLYDSDTISDSDSESTYPAISDLIQPNYNSDSNDSSSKSDLKCSSLSILKITSDSKANTNNKSILDEKNNDKDKITCTNMLTVPNNQSILYLPDI